MDDSNRTWPPETIIAYAAIVTGIWLIALASEGAHQALLTGGSVLALATLGLWRGVWVAWLFLVVVAHVGSSVVIIARWESSWFVAAALFMHGVLLALLGARPTRRHVRRGPRVLNLGRRDSA